MEINPKLYKLIKKFITREIKGSDVFIHNGSKWLIFEEDKKWVIELTKEGTLWYNYYFFQNIFELVDLDVLENQYYITKWVEDNVINGVKESRALEEWVNSEKIVDKTIQNGVKEIRKQQVASTQIIGNIIQNGVKSTKGEYYKEIQKVEYTIQNGVKETKSYVNNDFDMNDAIENGVKQTHAISSVSYNSLEDTIQNGVKHTQGSIFDNPTTVKDTIQNGVKHTEIGWHQYNNVEYAIQNGVKETNPHFLEIINPMNFEPEFIEMKRINEVNLVLEEGIKETTPGGYLGSVEIKGKTVHQFETAKQLYYVEDVIESGIKKTEGAMLFDESQIDRVISDGIKETHDDVMPHTGRVEGVIKNGVKKTVDALSSRLPNPVGDVIKNGVKQCIPSHTPLYNPMDFSVEYRENHRLDEVASVLEKGIKEVQPLPAQDGNKDWGNYYHRQEDRTKPHTKYVDDVITNGIKKTISGHADKREFVEKVVLEYSVKETWGYDKQPQIRIDNVIENGIRPTSEM